MDAKDANIDALRRVLQLDEDATRILVDALARANAMSDNEMIFPAAITARIGSVVLNAARDLDAALPPAPGEAPGDGDVVPAVLSKSLLDIAIAGTRLDGQSMRLLDRAANEVKLRANHPDYISTAVVSEMLRPAIAALKRAKVRVEALRAGHLPPTHEYAATLPRSRKILEELGLDYKATDAASRMIDAWGFRSADKELLAVMIYGRLSAQLSQIWSSVGAHDDILARHQGHLSRIIARLEAMGITGVDQPRVRVPPARRNYPDTLDTIDPAHFRKDDGSRADQLLAAFALEDAEKLKLSRVMQKLAITEDDPALVPAILHARLISEIDAVRAMVAQYKSTIDDLIATQSDLAASLEKLAEGPKKKPFSVPVDLDLDWLKSPWAIAAGAVAIIAGILWRIDFGAISASAASVSTQNALNIGIAFAVFAAIAVGAHVLNDDGRGRAKWDTLRIVSWMSGISAVDLAAWACSVFFG